MTGWAALSLIGGTVPVRMGGEILDVVATEQPALFWGGVTAMLVIGLPCVIGGHFLQVRDRLKRGPLTEVEKFERSVRAKFVSISIGFILLQSLGGFALYRAGNLREWFTDGLW